MPSVIHAEHLSQHDHLGLIGGGTRREDLHPLAPRPTRLFLKLGNIQRGGQKLKKLAYLLTPEGIQHRLAMTRIYLERKKGKYHAIQAELASLQAELEHWGNLHASHVFYDA